jgi:uncharacterized membrane protein YcfT
LKVERADPATAQEARVVAKSLSIGVPGRDGQARVDWVDYAKGLCIIMVVMMHSTLGVEAAVDQASWLNAAILFAQPFRMPDFFLISGLFLARVIDRDWRTYLDSKLVHFLYFYLLWALIQWSFKSLGPSIASGDPGAALPSLAAILWAPQGALWFIYLLPVFFIVTKLLRSFPPALVMGIAALLQMLSVDSGWFIADEFCHRFVFFLVGYHCAVHVFAIAGWIARHRALALAGLAMWALVNGSLVVAGIAFAPGLGLALGLAGALAVVAVSVLLAQTGRAGLLRYAGENSIVVFLSFFVPMVVTRTLLLKVPVITDVGSIALIVSAASVVTPLIAHRLLKGTRLRFLYERPSWTFTAWKAARSSPARMVPAE